MMVLAEGTLYVYISSGFPDEVLKDVQVLT